MPNNCFLFFFFTPDTEDASTEANIALQTVTDPEDATGAGTSQPQKKRRRCCDVGGKGCSIFNPRLLYGTSYFGATCLFLFSCNLTIFYDLCIIL